MGDGRWAMGDGRWAMGDGLRDYTLFVWYLATLDVNVPEFVGANKDGLTSFLLAFLKSGDTLWELSAAFVLGRSWPMAAAPSLEILGRVKGVW
jgi:hypothetical protein